MRKVICAVIVMVVLIFGVFIFFIKESPLLINMRELSMQENKEKFYNPKYTIIEETEAFLIELNTNNQNGYDTAFMDKNGHISSPFKETENLHSYILKTFSGLYKMSENEYINTMLVKVTDKEKISEAKKEKEQYYLNSYIDVTNTVEGKRINSYIEPKISGNILKVEKNGEYYLVTFSKGVLGLATYNLFCDNQGKIVGNMVFNAQDMVQIPKDDNEIGCFLYEGFGKVYFNTEGKVIWITYNKDYE